MTASIAHLSDPHVTGGPQSGVVAESLRRALGRALLVDPAPEAFVITGDLTEHGDIAEYEQLHRLIESFPAALFLVPGNHDDTANFLHVFGRSRFVNDQTKADYTVEADAFTLTCLDSSLPGSPAGRLSHEQLEYLDRTLRARSGVPSFIAVHHPPVVLGMPFYDAMRLESDRELGIVVGRHQHVARILAGHVHRVTMTPFASTLVTTAASTYLASDLALTAGVPHYVPDPTTLLLHTGSPGRVTTHVVNVSHAAARIAQF